MPTAKTNYTDALPPLSDEDLAALKEAIRREGVRVPILVDEHGSLIDGFHRKRIADELGLGCPVKVCPDLTDAQKLALAISTNTNRRQLHPAAVAELRSRWRAALPDHVSKNLHKSDRAIAKEVGASRNAVGRARRAVEVAPTQLSRGTVGKRVGLDGKLRKGAARRPSAPVPPSSRPQVRPELADLAERGGWSVSDGSLVEARLLDLEDDVAAVLVEQAVDEDWSAERLHNEAAIAALSDDMRVAVREKLRENGDDVATMSSAAMTAYLRRLESLHPATETTMPSAQRKPVGLYEAGPALLDDMKAGRNRSPLAHTVDDEDRASRLVGELTGVLDELTDAALARLAKDDGVKMLAKRLAALVKNPPAPLIAVVSPTRGRKGGAGLTSSPRT